MTAYSDAEPVVLVAGENNGSFSISNDKCELEGREIEMAAELRSRAEGN